MAETGRLVGLVVTLVAAIVVIVGVAVPIMSSVSDDIHVTAENEDYDARMSMLGTDSYYKIEKTGTGSIAITTEKGGDAVTYYGTAYSSEGTTLVDGLLGGYTGAGGIYIWILTDDFELRFRTTDTLLYLFGVEGTNTAGTSMNAVGAYIEWDGGTMTVYAASTGTYYYEDYTYVIVPDPDGEYVMTSAGWVAYGSEWFIVSNSAFGSIVQGGETDVKVTDATSVVVSDNTVEEGTRSAYIDIPTVTYTLDGSEATMNKTYSAIIVPLEYYTTTSSQDTILSIVDVIPLLLVLMILITGAYAVIRSTQE